MRGKEEYARRRNKRMEQAYGEFGHWFKRLGYSQYMKILALGDCIGHALANSIGHSISGGFDKELVELEYRIDRDFIRQPRPNAFWRELLRCGLYEFSTEEEIPIAEEWLRTGHPFLDKYYHNGILDLNKVFWQRCSFVISHQDPSIRIADSVNTILHRRFNKDLCRDAYATVEPCFCKDRAVNHVVLADFDVSQWEYDADKNPWRSLRGLADS